MEQRFTTYSQYAISTNVSGIKDIEAETVNGISVQKIYFQPDVNLSLAISQIVAATNAIRALLPTGTQPPIVVQYSASAVPVLQSLSAPTISLKRSFTITPFIGFGSWSRRSTASHCRRLPAENMGSSWSISTRQSCCPKA